MIGRWTASEWRVAVIGMRRLRNFCARVSGRPGDLPRAIVLHRAQRSSSSSANPTRSLSNLIDNLLSTGRLDSQMGQQGAESGSDGVVVAVDPDVTVGWSAVCRRPGPFMHLEPSRAWSTSARSAKRREMAAPSTATPGVRRDTGLGDASQSAKDDSGVKRSVRRCLPGLVRLVPIRSDEVGGALGDHDGGRMGMAADEARHH
jgi:hypothetical protein